MLKEFEYQEIEQLIERGKAVCIIDVRTENEFIDYNIPNSINLPILKNKEHKLVGETYVRVSREKAKKMGVKFASERLPELFDYINELYRKNDYVIAYCSRGGYRSSSIVALMNSIGIRIFKLKDGYKGYRGYINKKLPETLKMVKPIVVSGNTGVGKTNILKELRKKGEKIIDLEGLANHRGSLFGSIGIGKQFSQKKFEALLYEEVKSAGEGFYFVESESKRVGNVIVPDILFDKMKVADRIKIEASVEYRIEVLYNEYIEPFLSDEKKLQEEIFCVFEKLKNYMSAEKINNLHKMIEEKQYKKVIKIVMIDYYDNGYSTKKEVTDTIISDNIDEITKKLIEFKLYLSKSLDK